MPFALNSDQDRPDREPSRALSPALEMLARHGLARRPALELILVNPQTGLRVEEDSPRARAEMDSLERILHSALPPQTLDGACKEVMGAVFSRLMPAIYQKAGQYPSQLEFSVCSQADAGDIRENEVPAHFNFCTTCQPQFPPDEIHNFIEQELNRPLFDAFQHIYQTLLEPVVRNKLWDQAYFGGLRMRGAWMEPWELQDQPIVIYRNPFEGLPKSEVVDVNLVPRQVSARLIEPIDSDLHVSMKQLICYQILPEMLAMGLGLPDSLAVDVSWRPDQDQLADYRSLVHLSFGFSRKPPLADAELQRINEQYMKDELCRRTLSAFSQAVEERIWSRRDELDYQVMEAFFGVKYRFNLRTIRPPALDPFSSPN